MRDAVSKFALQRLFSVAFQLSLCYVLIVLMRRSPYIVSLILYVLPNLLLHGVVLDWTRFTDSNWSTQTNWSPNNLPSNGDELVFTGTLNTATLNGLAVDTLIESIELTNTGNAESFSLSGNRIELGSDITTTAVAIVGTDSIEDVIELDIVIVNSSASINAGAGHGVRVNGSISGGAGYQRRAQWLG